MVLRKEASEIEQCWGLSESAHHRYEQKADSCRGWLLCGAMDFVSKTLTTPAKKKRAKRG
jgi:hypothetical protein